MCRCPRRKLNATLASVAVGISCVGPWVGNGAFITILAVPLNTAPHRCDEFLYMWEYACHVYFQIKVSLREGHFQKYRHLLVSTENTIIGAGKGFAVFDHMSSC